MIFNPGIMAATGAAGVVTGSYTGNGSNQKNLNLGFEPVAILIISSPDAGANVHMLVAVNGAPKGLGSASSSTTKYRVAVNFSGEGILMGTPTDPNNQPFNYPNVVYNYIAIPKA
jgi:hypothetical protein